MAMLIIFVPAVILALLGVAALTIGVDSREDARDDRSPVRPTGLEV